MQQLGISQGTCVRQSLLLQRRRLVIYDAVERIYVVRTSIAERFGYRCPECSDELSRDPSGRGFVKHMNNRNCSFEAGERDTSDAPASIQSATTERAATLQPTQDARMRSLSTRGIERIRDMLERSVTKDCVMPPTELFNEGWLLRLALDWSAGRPDVSHHMNVPVGAKWYSEALLSSQFGAPFKENYTHADGVIGHFHIGKVGDGDLALTNDATHFVVFEAKLNSKLSKGTKNAPEFDQAARSVACMAHAMSVAKIPPSRMARLGFFVVAPASQIKRGVFASELTKDSLRMKVKQRIDTYKDNAHYQWLFDWFLPVLGCIEVDTMSWESIGEAIETHDREAGQWFEEFYGHCLRYNRVRD